jgi:LysR family transcriptional regulator of gallate degradation
MQQNLDSRKLFYFATVVELGSLKKAARQLSVSQPALSTSMTRLEKAVGMKLLERSPAGVVPTEFGELLCRHARLIKEEMAHVEARLRNSPKGDSRALTIGVLPSLAATIVPHAVAQWSRRHPRILLRIIEAVGITLLLELQRGNFDFIVGQTEHYSLTDGLKQRVLFRDHLTIFARPGHRLFEMPEITWSDAVRFPWVLPIVGGRQRTLLERIVTSNGVAMPKQLIECGSIDFTRTLLSASDYLALIPEHAAAFEAGDRQVRALPFADRVLRRDITAVFRERHQPNEAGRDLLRQIRAVGQKFSATR